MLQGDLYGMEGRVREIDPALALSYLGEGKYEMKRGPHYVMTLTHNELDCRLLERLRKNDLQRRRLQDIIYEMERSEDELERRKAKDMTNKIESMTLDQYDRLAGIKHFTLGGI